MKTQEETSIIQRLQSPFEPDAVHFRIDGNPVVEYNDRMVCRSVPYLESRDCMDRLDDVFGFDGWSFSARLSDKEQVDGKTMYSVIGSLIIDGVSKTDCGTDETLKGALSDCLKRCCVHIGIGRYLYRLPSLYADVIRSGKGWKITNESMKRLRARLPR